MTVVVSCINLKGGVGKTALAVNLSAYCGKNGFKTLLVDLDPQTNATFSCIKPETWDEHSKKNGTVADLLGVRNHVQAETKEINATDTIVKDVFTGVDLIPSHLDLFTIDLDIGARVARESLLKKALKPILGDYDIVICDCPPNLTLPTQNALAVSTNYVVPVSPDFLSSLGIALLMKRVTSFAEDLDVKLENSGIVLSRVGRPSLFREQTTQSIRDAFPEYVLKTEIRERSVVSEATALNKSIFDMNNPEAKAEFGGAADEILTNVGLT